MRLYSANICYKINWVIFKISKLPLTIFMYRTLIAASDELAEKLINHQLVSALLNVIANVYHPESQKYATENLLYLVSKFDYVATALRANMGQNFFDLLEVITLTLIRYIFF